jgi:hypothetical protein
MPPAPAIRAQTQQTTNPFRCSKLLRTATLQIAGYAGGVPTKALRYSNHYSGSWSRLSSVASAAALSLLLYTKHIHIPLAVLVSTSAKVGDTRW